MPSEHDEADDARLPAWLARCLLTGILAGLGAAASLLYGFGRF
jgi:hypothetical protein